MSQLTVAVLGTGIMGSAMARNIAGAGHAVRAWNRTISRAQPLADDGIEIVPTATAAVEGADVVITMLFDGALDGGGGGGSDLDAVVGQGLGT